MRSAPPRWSVRFASTFRALSVLLAAAPALVGGCAWMGASSPPPQSFEGAGSEESDQAANAEELAPAAPESGATLFKAAPMARAAAQEAAPAPAPPPGIPATPMLATKPSERYVVTGRIEVISEDVAGLAAAIRAHTPEVGGAVASESINGDPEHAQATLQLRLPPREMTAFGDWLVARARLGSRHFGSADVTAQWFDRELAIKNLHITMARLQELARRPNAELKDVMEVEREMTRVRGEIERLEGAQRLLDDQVARATLTIDIRMKHGTHVEPELKFELVPHLSLVHLVDAAGRESRRGGGGVSMMFSRWFSLDFEILAQHGPDPRSYLATAATGMYSDFLGGGRRRYGNPYLGFRLGGAKLNGLGAFAYGAEVGLEIVRYRLFLLEISGRALGLWYNRDNPPKSDILLEGTVGVGVPF